jgi:hypothetical protein
MPLAAIYRSTFDLVLVQALVEVEALEQKLDHRRPDLRAIR